MKSGPCNLHVICKLANHGSSWYLVQRCLEIHFRDDLHWLNCVCNVLEEELFRDFVSLKLLFVMNFIVSIAKIKIWPCFIVVL